MNSTTESIIPRNLIEGANNNSFRCALRSEIRLNSDQLNDFFERKYHAEGSLYAIHVTDVVADGAPMSLEDFGALLDKPVVRAPQSWQYINI